MKILVVSPHFSPFIGGAENHVLRISNELRKLKHEIVVFTSTNTSKDLNGIKVYSFPALFTYSNTPFNFWQTDLHNVILKERPDIVAGSLSTPFMADFAAKTSQKFKIPFFLFYFNDYIKQNFFENFFLKFYYSFFLKKTFRLSSKIIVLSDYYAKKSLLLKPFLNKTVSVSPFIDLNEFNFDSKKPKDYSVLFVGALNKGQKYKGLDYLIKAVSLLKKNFPEIKLVVVGKGNNLDYFKELCRKNRIKENVFFAGEVSQKQLFSFYSDCGVLVLPSVNDSEGFGLVFLEAMAFSKSVIGTKTGGIPAIVKHNFNGLLVEPKNENDLSKAIELILTDKKKAKELGLNAFNTAKSFSPEKSINKLIKLFEESLNEKRS